ncbi:unnamed protein product [Symbiodinium necroappetens]|uniref:Uncharacterized protein n=1 Tax=Symbiodinium necroappetens TaxID=1628268 RepID=A0A812VV31_9DINO|nr:unnamed protein product [Symbiodinium necroappetens]
MHGLTTCDRPRAKLHAGLLGYPSKALSSANTKAECLLGIHPCLNCPGSLQPEDSESSVVKPEGFDLGHSPKSQNVERFRKHDVALCPAMLQLITSGAFGTITSE